jgi:hypothetical protein
MSFSPVLDRVKKRLVEEIKIPLPTINIFSNI